MASSLQPPFVGRMLAWAAKIDAVPLTERRRRFARSTAFSSAGVMLFWVTTLRSHDAFLLFFGITIGVLGVINFLVSAWALRRHRRDLRTAVGLGCVVGGVTLTVIASQHAPYAFALETASIVVGLIFVFTGFALSLRAGSPVVKATTR